MCWPLYLTFVWICADGIALRYDRKLGYGMVGFTVFYLSLIHIFPLPDYVFKADDAVMVLGLNADVDKLVRKL